LLIWRHKGKAIRSFKWCLLKTAKNPQRILGANLKYHFLSFSRLGGIMGGHSNPRGIVVDIQFARGLVQSPPVRAVTERLVLREPAGADMEGLTVRRLYLIRPVPVVSHEPSHYVIRHLTRLKIFFSKFF
jgi:hypothetical protein